MALNLGPLNVLLRLQGADKFKRDTRQATSGVAKLGKAIGGLVAIQQVTQQFVQATQVFAEFERGMVRVGAVTNSLGSTAFAGLTERAQDLAKTTEFTARQVADAMGFMGMAGMKTNQIFEATPAVLQLASAGMVDVASAADTVTNIMAGYGLKTEDLSNANNVLVATFTNSNTSLQQLGQSFKYVGPVAKSAGVEFKEAAAVIGLMGNAGIQADMAGTALRGTIIKLLDPTAEGAKIMRQYGINVQDSNGKLKPMVEIFRQLEPIADDSAKMIELFGLRAGPGMQAALTQGTEKLEELINKIEGAGNIAERIAKAQMETLDGKIKIMKSNFEALQIAIGDALGSKTAKLVGFLANRFDDLAWSIKTVSKALADPVAQAAQSEAEIRRQQNAMRQREIGRMLQTGFYRASYPMGHPLAGTKVSPTMLQAQGATAGMMAGTEPGRLAGVTESQRVALQAELNRLREEEKKLIGAEVKLRKEKEKKDKADTSKAKRPRSFVEQIEGAAGVDAVRALFEGMRDQPIMGLAEMSNKEFDAFMESFKPDVVIDHSEALKEAGMSAKEMSRQMSQAQRGIEAVTSGRIGGTLGPELGAMAGTAIGAAVSGGAGGALGGAIGSALGGVFGSAFDDLVSSLNVLTPYFDLVGKLLKALSPALKVMAQGTKIFADAIYRAIGPMLETISGVFGKLFYVTVTLMSALWPLIGTLINLTLQIGQLGLIQVLDFVAEGLVFFAEKVIIPIGEGLLEWYNGAIDFLNQITETIRGFEFMGQKPFKTFGVLLDNVNAELPTYEEIILAEMDARDQSTRSLKEFNEELTNVPTGIKRLRAFQFGAMQGSGRGTPFGQSAFGV
jgi:TP901 family phage tail tape measure protein